MFLADQLVKQLLAGPGASTPEELLAQPAPDRPGMKLSELLEEVVGKIREKMVLARVLRAEGPVGVYAHHDGKTGVLFRASGTEPLVRIYAEAKSLKRSKDILEFGRQQVDPI